MPSKNQQCTMPIRLPVELKEWAKDHAKAQNISVNALVIRLLEQHRATQQNA